jgi:hypothetical protein
MSKQKYQSMESVVHVNRRDLLKLGAGAGLLLGRPTLWAQDAQKPQPPPRPKTNIDEALRVPKTSHSLPGPYPGRVVQVMDTESIRENQVQADVVKKMFAKGIMQLTGMDMKESFGRLFDKKDVVGIKVNPVGPGIIATHLEVIDAVVAWLEENGIDRRRMVIWDRFDYMLKDAGFTPERFPGIRIEGLQTMDEAAAEGKSSDNSRWLKADGTHVSADLFDRSVYYWADVEGDKEPAYLNQHVFNERYSYFGKLLTQRLSKIINIPVFKNTGNGISMATKNIGYGAICNTARLHRPLFFDVCTEVLAFPVIRDKMVLNITDGLRGQYDGGPGPAAQFGYDYHSLFFATDPFALDSVCHRLLVDKRKAMQVKVNEHPRFTDYLRYAERLGLGVAQPEKITHRVV